MKVAIIADAFPPMRTSGAIQIKDLADEFINQGHQVTILLPSPELKSPYFLVKDGSIHVLRLRTPIFKDVSSLRRAFGEFIIPKTMIKNLRLSPFMNIKWDGVVWYSPTIFFGPLVHILKKKATVEVT